MTNIFLTYLGISATVSIVVLLILLASPLINRRYAVKWKYYIWIFLAIRLIIPISGMYHAKSQSPAIGDPAQSSGAVVYEPEEAQGVQPRRFVVEISVGTAVQSAPTSETATGKQNPTLFDVIIAVWIAGAVIFVSVPIISCMHYKFRITHAGKRIESGSAFDTLCKLKSQLEIKKNVPLMRFNQAASPMIIGFIRPIMVLPCDEYSEEELQFIIRHELIHLKRGDVYVKLLCVIANALHWFNPLIWIMRREMAVDMELSCDEGVIKGADFDIKKAYTETLMSSLRRQSSKRSSLTTQFYGGKGTMKKRFSNILGKGGKKNGIAVLIFAVVLATLLGVLVGCTQKTPAEDGLGESFADLPDTDTANGEPTSPIDGGTIALPENEAAPTTTATEPTASVTEATPSVTEAENDEPVVVPVDEETTALANEIMEGLLDDYREAVNILLLNAAKPVSYSNGVDEYGNLVIDGDEWYIRMQDEYNTPEKVMDVMHSVFTNEKCDAIYLQYFVESETFKMIDGELCCVDGGRGYSSFNTPFEGAGQISDTEILAKTRVVYDGVDYPYEVTFKYEDGEWKIDKLAEDGMEVNF